MKLKRTSPHFNFLLTRSLIPDTTTTTVAAYLPKASSNIFFFFAYLEFNSLHNTAATYLPSFVLLVRLKINTKICYLV